MILLYHENYICASYLFNVVLVLRKFFPSFFHDYENNKKTLASLNEQVLSLTEDKTKLESEIKKLKSERDSMHNKLKSITNI